MAKSGQRPGYRGPHPVGPRRSVHPAIRAAAAAAQVVVVSRRRKDAALRDVPVPVPAGRRKRGRPRTYGRKAVSLAKRAGQTRGWQTSTFALYGKAPVRRYTTFLATYK